MYLKAKVFVNLSLNKQKMLTTHRYYVNQKTDKQNMLAVLTAEDSKKRPTIMTWNELYVSHRNSFRTII